MIRAWLRDFNLLLYLHDVFSNRDNIIHNMMRFIILHITHHNTDMLQFCKRNNRFVHDHQRVKILIIQQTTNSQDRDTMQQGKTSNNSDGVANPVMKNSTEATCQYPLLPPLEGVNDQQKENREELPSRQELFTVNNLAEPNSDKLANAAPSSSYENNDNMMRNPHQQNDQPQTHQPNEQHPNNGVPSQSVASNSVEQHPQLIKSEDLSNDVPPTPAIPPFYLEQQQQHEQPAHSHLYYYQHPYSSHYHSSDQQLNPIHQQPPINDPSRNGHSFHEYPPPSFPGHPPYNYSPSAPQYPLPRQEHHLHAQHPPYQQHHHHFKYQSQQHSYYHHQPASTNLGFNTDRPTYHFSLPTDTQSLSDRQCYIRSNLIELFLATEQDVSTRPARGAQRIHVGQVGIRCAYCVDNNADRKDPRKFMQPFEQAPPRAERAVCFPQSLSRIYQTVADMQRRHFDKCRRIPVQVMGTYKSLKTTRPRGKGTPQAYWASSAEEIGLVDSDGMGIRVREDGEGKMVNQFLMQRKSMEGGGDGEDVEHYSNDNDLTAAVQDGGEGGNCDGMPPSKRRKSMNENGENISGGEGQSSSQNNNGGQKTSYSDAHLLASMRVGASPSFQVVDNAGVINASENGDVAVTQLNDDGEGRRGEV